MSSHRRRVIGQNCPPRGSEQAAAEGELARLVGVARRSIGVVLSGDDEHARAVCEAIDGLGSERCRDLAIRVLCTPSALSCGNLRALATVGPRSEIRVAVAGVRATVIVDGRVALVAMRDRAAEAGSAIQDPAVVRVLESLFAGAWCAAMTPVDYGRLGSRARTRSARQILHHLSAGLTDDVAAREMGVSLRTYRRHVAELMRALGAHSRFQAGARAVELGLMPDSD